MATRADINEGFALNNITSGITAIQQGTIDGMDVVTVPTSYMPAGVNFIIKHKGCTVDPVKLQNYHIRKDAQGFDGPVVEGRIYFDSFVLDAKKAGVGVYKVS